MPEMLLTLATVILHLGVGIAIALRGRLILAAFISASIVAVPLIFVRLFGSPREVKSFLVVSATPLVAISILVGIAGAIASLVRWGRGAR